MKSITLILTLLMLLINSLFADDSRYYKYSEENSTLYIVPNFDIQIETDFLSVITNDSFINQLYFALNSGTNYKSIQVLSNDFYIPLSKKLLFDKNAQFTMNLPSVKDPIILDFDSERIDFLLFLEHINLKVIQENPLTMEMQLYYALWDNYNSRIVKHGFFNDQTTFNSVNVLQDLEVLLSNFVKNLAQQKSKEYLKEKYSCIAIKLGGSYHIHIEDKDSDDPNVPNFIEQPQTHPSVYHFFENAFSFSPALEYRYHNKKSRFTFGLEYHYEELPMKKNLFTINDISPSSQNLIIHSIGGSFAYGFRLPNENTSYAFFKGHLKSKNYEGEFVVNNLSGTILIDDQTSVSLSMGIDILVSNSSIEFFGEVGFEFSSAYLSDIKIGPTTQAYNHELSDNQFFIRFGISNLFFL